jgi:hypothetical protein
VRTVPVFTKRASFVVTLLRFWAGKALNAIGVPGIVQPGTYEAGVGPASVRIAVGPLFTVVTVNGVDVYLHRLTGAIDGVGFGVSASTSEPAWSERRETWSEHATPNPSSPS